MRKILSLLSLFVFMFLFTGCSNSINELTYNELEKKINNKETFILEVVQTGCSNCEYFTPKFKEVLNKYNINAVSINTSDFNEDDKEKFNSVFNISGTPTVIFITKGKEEYIYQRIVGNVEKDIIITKLKKAGYIKEK